MFFVGCSTLPKLVYAIREENIHDTHNQEVDAVKMNHEYLLYILRKQE